MQPSKQIGISVIICCYNSKSRLKPTLEALCKQVVDSKLLWEIIIVDNASDDYTTAEATSIWNSFTGKPIINFEIVIQPLPGLANARRKGISVAQYQYLLFCDDDNWLAENYVQGVYDILNGNDDIGACGGQGFPVFETEKPVWFDSYAEAFALGPQSLNEENNVLLNLYGAGMAINSKVLEKLEQNNFKPQMTGRTGKKLSSAEDTELTYALVLMGYKLHYAKDLHFFHYLPEQRLKFDYLKQLFIAFGTDGPVRNLYYAHLSKRFFHKMICNWYLHFLLSVVRFFKYLLIPPKKYGRTIYFNWNIAYIKQLFFLKRKYTSIKTNILSLKHSQPPEVFSNKQQYYPIPV
ncbi:glycosyltransferase [Ferruginibacter sp.]